MHYVHYIWLDYSVIKILVDKHLFDKERIIVRMIMISVFQCSGPLLIVLVRIIKMMTVSIFFSSNYGNLKFVNNVKLTAITSLENIVRGKCKEAAMYQVPSCASHSPRDCIAI